METLFWICVGIVIGWNMPQPDWARELQAKLVNAVRSIGGDRRR